MAQRLAVPEPGRTRVVDHLSVDRACLGLVLGKDDAMAAPAREERRLRSHEAEQGGGGEREVTSGDAADAAAVRAEKDTQNALPWWPL